MKTEISSDERTVWVNSGRGGLCLGRFGRGGIDIHSAPQQDGALQTCLDCTHTRPTLEDWKRFVKGMKDHHDIHVGEKYRPSWLKE